MNEIFKALKDTGAYEVTVNNSIFNNTMIIEKMYYQTEKKVFELVEDF